MNLWLLAIYAASLGLYFPLNHRPSKYYFPSKIDLKIPLIPVSVWFYMSYYLVHPLAIFLLWRSSEIKTLLFALIISTITSSLIWWLFPNGVKRPKLESTDSISQKLLYHIYSKDSDSNGFPSGHISHTIICSYFLITAFPHYFNLFYFWCIAICISTLTTKQHYIFDYIFTVPLTIIIISGTRLVM